MKQLSHPFQPLAVYVRPSGMRRMGICSQTRYPFIVEGVNGISDTLVTAVQIGPYLPWASPLVAGKQDLAPPDDEGIG